MPTLALQQQVEQAVEILRNGGVVAFPTDTLYGLGGLITEPKAINRIFDIKGRAASSPLPVLLSDARELDHVVPQAGPLARKLAQEFWPGSLTLVLAKPSWISNVVTGNLDTIGLRIPSHWVPRALISALGTPITGTSANRTGGTAPISAEDVRREIGASVNLIIDGGPCPVGIASTIVDVTGSIPKILREGAISAADVEKVWRST